MLTLSELTAGRFMGRVMAVYDVSVMGTVAVRTGNAVEGTLGSAGNAIELARLSVLSMLVCVR